VDDPRGDGLSIGELAGRTDVPAATLRSWESRYGFPVPRRLAGGHRRYDQGDIALIEDVLRLRASGMSLPTAISQVTTHAQRAEPSVFAGLRRRHPSLVSQVLRKTTLLALTRAVEDECCARAESAALFASFQSERHYRQSQQRWQELARTARVVVVFADFGPSSKTDASPLKITLPADSPMRREWTLVCEARDYPACVTGWEFPGQRETDADRRFEVMWSVDPRVVRDAMTICAELAESLAPGAGRLLSGLPSDPPLPASADLHRAAGLLTRMTGYLERTARPSGGAPSRRRTRSDAPDR
jgi:MerR family transcriptional regulator, light-induced transcriptional regulator